jgi:hypothetical protein
MQCDNMTTSHMTIGHMCYFYKYLNIKESRKKKITMFLKLKHGLIVN